MSLAEQKMTMAYWKIFKYRGFFKKPEITFEEVEILSERKVQDANYSVFLLKRKDGTLIEETSSYVYKCIENI